MDDPYSECIFRGTDLNIFINSSNFESQRARSFDLSASNITLAIYNSSFCGQRVTGNGGVVSLKGNDLCKVTVSNSSFVDMTAARGGAVDIACSNINIVSFERNSFKGNSAKNGSGGALYIYSPNVRSNESYCSKRNSTKFHYNGQSTEHLPQINIRECDFINAYSFSGGGAVNIHVLKTSVRLSQSKFIDCHSDSVSFGGGGILINTTFTSPQRTSSNCILLMVLNSLFKGCKSAHSEIGGSLSILTETKNKIIINETHFISNYGGALNIWCKVNNGRGSISHVFIQHSIFLGNSITFAINIMVSAKSIVTFEDVIMESNTAHAGSLGGAVLIGHNCTLTIQRSRFLKNVGVGWGATLSLLSLNLIIVQDSTFDSNYISDATSGTLGFGGAVYSLSDTSSIPIIILNTTFSNCSAAQGGALYIFAEGNALVEVKNSRFVDNFVLSNDYITFGGAVYLSFAPDTQINPGCIIEQETSRERKSVDSYEFPSWAYKSNITFENSVFVRNAGAVGGALYTLKGYESFRNCSFIDNVATFQGGHIYTGAGSSSIDIQNCIFRQKVLRQLPNQGTKTTFIHSKSSGALKLYNTTMDSHPYETDFLLLVRNGRLIDLGNNNLTIFNCPNGSQINIINYTDQVTLRVNKKPCKIKVTTLEVCCSTCEGNLYSLQHG